jgi:polygalacturonase
MKRISFFLRAAALAVVIPTALSAAKTCDVRSFGARGDGVAKDTKAVQQAIDACSAVRGGGTVRLSGGRFLIAPIEIRSNVTRDVEKDAVLLGSTDRANYPPAVRMRQHTVAPLLSITNAVNVTIEGGGVIDGQGKVWWDYVKGVKDSGVLGIGESRAG